MKRPQHQSTAKIAADAKADDLASYIKHLRMAVNAGNSGRADFLLGKIEHNLKHASDDVSLEIAELSAYISGSLPKEITEPRRRCLNVLVGALDSMVNLIEE